jgi:hypothetical protein
MVTFKASKRRVYTKDGIRWHGNGIIFRKIPEILYKIFLENVILRNTEYEIKKKRKIHLLFSRIC